METPDEIEASLRELMWSDPYAYFSCKQRPDAPEHTLWIGDIPVLMFNTPTCYFGIWMALCQELAAELGHGNPYKLGGVAPQGSEVNLSV
jgi:hypothetical protein